MKEFLTHLFTDGTNVTFDFTKAMGFLAIVTYCTLSFLSKGIFDPLNWATGISIILAAAGGVSKIVDKSGSK